MIEIQLNEGRWRVDLTRQLGQRGGFGEVFVGSGDDGRAVAVKRLKLTAEDAAYRELAIAEELRDLASDHVIPVLDSGQDAGSGRYFLVMPIADENLEEHLERTGPLSPEASVGILGQIAAGLADASAIVHRDLKPQNILLLDGRWQIADFGIARFTEKSTSLQTLKAALTPAYAAPEQWRMERATAATDIYALGCVAYRMVSGNLPFDGKSESFRIQHLQRQAQPLVTHAALRSLVSMMMRKAPEARPNLQRVQELLARLQENAGEGAGGIRRLQEAAAVHAEARAAEEAEEATIGGVLDARRRLADEARQILWEGFRLLAARISEATPGAVVSEKESEFAVRVGDAKLELDLIDISEVIARDAFAHSGWDVICRAAIGVEEGSGHQRSASLWYTRRNFPQHDPRWYEVGYRTNPISGKSFEYEPTAVTIELADRAHWVAMDVITTAYNPIPVDDEDFEGFCDRWIWLLAQAVEGGLSKLPTSLPSID